MCKVFKGLFLLLIVLCLLNVVKVSAADVYFVWEKTEILVPLNASLENYKNSYEVSFYVNGRKSTDFTVEKEVNCSTFSTVLTNKIGKYTVYYKAKSEKYYVSSTQAIIFNVVDITKPNITQIADVVLESGKGFKIENYFYFSDDTTSKDELNIILDDSYVLYNIVGEYDAKLTVIDKFNNKTEKKFKIKIKDSSKPQIIIQKPLILSYGASIDVNEYFVAIDDCNGDLTNFIKVEGYDSKKLGHQEITVSVSDYSNNTIRMKVSVNVIDDESPMLLLKHNEVTLNIKEYSSFNFDYFKNYILDISDNHTSIDKLVLSIDHSKVLNEIGDFEVSYYVKDLSENITTEKMIVKLRELKGPDLIGEDIVTIKLGEEIDLLSLVEVKDEYDSNAIDRLEILSSNLNTCIVGNYEVTYICYNSSGNYSTKVIVIEVIDDLGVENNQKEEVVDKNDKEELENSKNPISNENDKDVENSNKLDFLFKTIDVNSKVVFDFILVILIIILLIIIFKKRN